MGLSPSLSGGEFSQFASYSQLRQSLTGAAKAIAFLYRFSAPQCIKYTIQRKEIGRFWGSR